VTDERTPVPSPDPAVPWIAPVESSGPAPGIEWAPHGPRLLAYLIDGLILTVIWLILFIPTFIVFADREARPDTPAIIGFVLVLVVYLVIVLGYFPFFWARGGQTPGMRPFRLWVVRDQDGTPFGWGTASLRVLGLYVASSVFYLGFIWIFLDKRRRGWHDLIAGTVVVRRRRDPAPQEG
jgi:uncharacterized RDD family membrane protein YckC